MIAFTVHVDLCDGSADDVGRADRHALRDVQSIPSGARLVVNVGARQWPSEDALRVLHAAAQRLGVEVVAASPHVALTWHAALAGQEPPTPDYGKWSA